MKHYEMEEDKDTTELIHLTLVCCKQLVHMFLLEG
jgi:hypothetical protein